MFKLFKSFKLFDRLRAANSFKLPRAVDDFLDLNISNDSVVSNILNERSDRTALLT